MLRLSQNQKTINSVRLVKVWYTVRCKYMIYIFIYSTLPLVTNPCLGCARAWVGLRNKGRDGPRKEHFLRQPKARIE